MTESTNQASPDGPEATENEPAALPTSTPSESGESTVGTGTFFALGCTIATVIVILVGIAIIYVLR